MMTNNPVYTMRFIDLVNMYGDSFTYEDLYKVVGEWLGAEQQYFVAPDDNVLWHRFIESLCDRFYSRNLNFDTTLEFKLKLRDVLRKYKSQAERILEADMIKINPLVTYSNKVKRSEESKGDSSGTTNSNSHSVNSSDSTFKDTSNSNSVNSDEAFNYRLHSDTPSNAINIDDLFSVAKNYVTDADNNKSTNNGTLESSTSSEAVNKTTGVNDTDSANNSSNTFNNSSVYDELSSGYNGNPSELLARYMELVTDVVTYYLDWIEDECLFSSVLY